MKMGLEYASSADKRSLDLAVAAALIPLSWVCRATVTVDLMLKNAEDLTAVFEQERSGRDGAPFTIKKVRTLNPFNHQPYGRVSGVLRKLGLDESAQAVNILDGTMCAVGFRPLIPDEYEEVMDNLDSYHKSRWQRVVTHTRPGIFSSFAYFYRQHPEPNPDFYNMRADMDYKDFVEQGSLAHDLRLIGRAFCLAQTNN